MKPLIFAMWDRRAPRILIALMVFMFGARHVSAQDWIDAGADAVVSFTPGPGQTIGHGSEYYPRNVLGLPDPSSRVDVPSNDPVHVLALGRGGEITLRFDRHVIIDRPGPDFTVFENAFRYTLGSRSRVFAEPGLVSVSRDGVEFTAFPFDSLTLEGCAGVTPTNGDRNPGDPLVSGGDSFDLADLGLDSVRYVRIRDITSIVAGNRDHPLWDPTLIAFDLDAVVVATASSSVGVVGDNERGSARVTASPNPFTTSLDLALSLDAGGDVRVRVYDSRGENVVTLDRGLLGAGAHRLRLALGDLPAGLYLLRVDLDGRPIETLRIARVE